MPKRRQYFHASVNGLTCLLFAGLGLFHLRLIFPATGVRPSAEATALSAGFVALAIGAIALQMWFRGRIVREFSYDGSTLRFRTLGVSAAHTYALSQVTAIGDWIGRRGPIGYRLLFQDGRKAYFEFAVPNAAALPERFRRG